MINVVWSCVSVVATFLQFSKNIVNVCIESIENKYLCVCLSYSKAGNINKKYFFNKTVI